MASAPAPSPSIFLSYASEDRAAVRRLRDALSTTGLDVWYDENELGGGDAWDQKIRRQIRECTYFMPVISATTEARREGYFRREWRLATERTLDMADDVTFLLPIVIDDTRQDGARVPEKFNSVQWLRVPGGESTPSLLALCRRLAAEHAPAVEEPPSAPPPIPRRRGVSPVQPAAPASIPPAAGAKPSRDEHAHETPPEMPPFPHGPGPGDKHGAKYVAEILWWVVTAIWVLLKRLPKWARVLVVIWFVFTGLSRCDSTSSNNNNNSHRKSSERDRPPKPPSVQTETQARAGRDEARKAFAEISEKLKQSSKENPGGAGAEFAKLGSELAQQIATGIGAAAPRTAYGFLPFALGVEDPAAAKFSREVFEGAYGRLALALNGDLGVVRMPGNQARADSGVAMEMARQAGHANLVLGTVETTPEGQFLVVRVLSTASGEVRWTERFAVTGADPAAVAGQVAEGTMSTHVEKP